MGDAPGIPVRPRGDFLSSVTFGGVGGLAECAVGGEGGGDEGGGTAADGVGRECAGQAPAGGPRHPSPGGGIPPKANGPRDLRKAGLFGMMRPVVRGIWYEGMERCA